MRLTLRTLLAYRDGVLSPADKEDLHRRIQISQDAGNLLKRIGAVTKLNHVLAPPVMGKGIGGDPNSVAEYLDDVLNHTQIPELERNCLVSDMQLAELADCHELLSTAMNTKVTVPASLRRMAFAVGDPGQREQIRLELEERKAPRRSSRRATIVRADPAHLLNVAGAHDMSVQIEAPMLTSGGESIKPQGLNLENSRLAHEVPEYLVGSSSINWKIPLAIGGLGALLAVLVWQTLGPWERVAELFASTPVKTKNSALPPASVDFDLITETTVPPPGIDEAAKPKPGVSQPTTDLEQPENSATESVPPAATVDAGENSPLEIVADSSPPPGLGMPAEPEAPPGIDASSSAPPGLDALPKSAAPPGVKEIGDASRSAIWLPKSVDDEKAVFLLQSTDRLVRVAPNEPIFLPARLLVPPTTRATIDLSNGALWTSCGASILELGATDDTSPPLITTQLCSGLVRSGPVGNQIRLHTPLGNFLLQLNEAESLASVEVAYRPVKHGSALDPTSFSPVLIVMAAESSITLTPEDQATAPVPLAIGEGIAVTAAAKSIRFPLQNIPSWYRSSVDRPIDALAAQDLNGLISTTTVDSTTLAPLLSELTKHRRPETAALAVQLSLLAGDWRPFVDGFLSESRMRNHWTTTIDLARQLLAADTVTADNARKLFDEVHAAEGPVLYELLCGPPEDQLNQEKFAKIVSQLDSPLLAHRVLAIHLLQRLTGKNLGFQPALPNRSSVQQWRREISTNRLALTQNLELIWERLPR